jgi:hypothetical protein
LKLQNKIIITIEQIIKNIKNSCNGGLKWLKKRVFL